MPLRTDLPTTYPDYFSRDPEYKLFADQAARTVEVPNVPNSVEIWQTFRDAYSSSVIFGKTSVDDGADRRPPTRSTSSPASPDRRPPMTSGTASPRRPRLADAGAPAADGRPRPPAAGHRSSPRPYAVFLAAIFAYPLGLAVWISFHDYFFTAPGRAGAAAVRRASTTTRRC